MAISKLSTTASLKQVMDKFEEISLKDFSSIDIITAEKLPNGGKEGQLCIITSTTPKNIYFNYVKPSLSNTDIFIKYELQSSYDSYIIKSKATHVTLKIRNIIQVINNVETPVYGYIYTNSQWKRLVPESMYIFKKSTGLLSGITYSTSKKESGINFGYSYVTCSHTTSNITFLYHSMNGCHVEADLNFSKIDISSYDYLHVDFECTCGYPSSVTEAPSIRIQVINSSGSVVVNNLYTYRGYPWTVPRMTAKINISNLSGEHTIRFKGYAANGYSSDQTSAAKTYIHNLVLGGDVL